jgi:hypothetical protein
MNKQTDDSGLAACMNRALEAASFMMNMTPQLSSFDAMAHGISLHTSEGIVDEMIEMMVFSNQAARVGVSCLVKHVDYDSNQGVATITLKCKIDQEATDVLKDLANRLFSLYRWENGFMGGRNF